MGIFVMKYLPCLIAPEIHRGRLEENAAYNFNGGSREDLYQRKRL
jgi:hypothetical protein